MPDDTTASVAAAASASSPVKDQAPPTEPAETDGRAVEPPSADAAEEGPEVEEVEESLRWGAAPIAVAPAELLWRKWLLLATAPVAGLVIAVAVWGYLSSRPRPEVPPAPVAEEPDQPVPVVEEPPPEEPAPEPVAARLNPRWLPGGTRLLTSLRISRLADREEFELAFPLIEPAWQPVLGEMLSAFGLKIDRIRHLSWASTELGAWPDPGLIVVELVEGQDAGVFRRVGEQIDVQLDGEPCRRLTRESWPYPFVIPDELTIISGREESLRELADRSEPHLESLPMERLLKATPADADAALLVDLTAAREAGWHLPTSLMDVWPEGREAWHVIWDVPQGLGISLRRSGTTASQIALACESETAAQGVKSALDELIPAAKAAMQGHTESLGERLPAPGAAAQPEDRYVESLTRGLAALESARCELADETVWLRTDWGEDFAETVAATLDSRPQIVHAWLGAALSADEAVQRKLLAGLGKHHESAGHFPAGAGGTAILAPETRLSWIASMLPYYGHPDWHRELSFGYSWNGSQNRPVTQRRLDEVINPALGPGATEAGFPVTHYVGVAGVGPDAGELGPGHPRAGVFGFNRTTRMEDIGDGAGNTIAILGVTKNVGAWAAGGTASVRPLTKPPYVNGYDGFGSGQPNGMLVGMADGSVRFLSKEIDPGVLEQLATIGGGEDVTAASLRTTRAPQPPIEPVAPPPGAGGVAQQAVPDPAGFKPGPGPVPEGPRLELSGPEEPSDVDVQARLADRVVEIGFPSVPLVDAVDLLAQLSGLEVTFDTDAMAEIGVKIRDPVTVQLADATLGEVFEAVVAHRGLVYVVENGQILISSPAKRRNALRSVEYTVLDLTGPERASTAKLAETIEQLVAPETWSRSGGRGTIEPGNGLLKVVQIDGVHGQIVTFCEKLRTARRLPLRSRQAPERFTLATRWDQARPKLELPITANFFEPTRLEQITSDLEQVSGLKILINRMAMTARGMPSQITATLKADGQPLHEALDALLRPLGLAFRVIDAATLEITTRQEIAARLELEFHPVGDLLTEGETPSSLMGKIRAQVAGGTWSEDSGPGVLAFDKASTCLLVLQSQPVQFELETLLERWRAERKKRQSDAPP